MSWRDRIVFLVPIPETLVLMVLGVLALAAPFLIPLLLLVLLGLTV
jgi:membrane protein DedA with SNARE-associated domain